MSLLRELLISAVKAGASDLHLKVDQIPALRIHYNLQPFGKDKLTSEDLHQMVEDIIPPHARRRYELKHEVDFSLEEADVGRFRVNIFLSHGMPTIAMRHVKTKIPSFEELHLPLGLKDLVNTPRGIILASGTTGCGKSTTLAALIQQINLTQRRRIITIEDPIEYVFEDVKSICSQREVGLDTVSFNSALRHVLRQDPDVIMIGEMRDAQSFTAAIETGTEDGMQTFNQAIYQLIKSGMITEEEGMPRAGNPETLKMNLKGIFLDEARRILST